MGVVTAVPERDSSTLVELHVILQAQHIPGIAELTPLYREAQFIGSLNTSIPALFVRHVSTFLAGTSRFRVIESKLALGGRRRCGFSGSRQARCYPICFLSDPRPLACKPAHD